MQIEFIVLSAFALILLVPLFLLVFKNSKLAQVNENLNQDNSKLSQDISAKMAALGFLEEQKVLAKNQNLELQDQVFFLQKEAKIDAEKLIILEQEKIFLEKEKESLKTWVAENSERMQKDFELLSNKIFNEAKVKFSEENKDKISTILNPLKVDLKEFSLRLERMSEANNNKHTSLVEQIKYLGELNKQVSDDANMLANVLKSDNKAAGDWGEMILEKILESCGFLEEEHFFKQQSLRSEAGEIFRPDIVLKLPEKRSIIIDSKVSLVDFLKYSTGELAEDVALKSFKASITNHIKILSAKKYEDLIGIKSPEFVLIFIPIEGAFSLISRKLQELFELAYANKIVLASPSTILTALKTIEFLWRVDKQEKNSVEIAKLGGLLHERVVLFMNRFKDLGSKIEATQKIYLDAEKTLYEGKSSITNTAQRLEGLGAKTKAKISVDNPD